MSQGLTNSPIEAGRAVAATPRRRHETGRHAVRRIALVISELCGGGAERVVVYLAGALRRLGHKALVICLQREGELAGELTAQGVPLVALNSLSGYDFGAIRRLARALRRFGPDVINVHDRASLPYVRLASMLVGSPPVVFSAHGLLMQDHGRARLRDRLSMGCVRAVTAVSETAAQEYAVMLGWTGPVEVIRNGVPQTACDAEARKRLRAELNAADRFAFLAVGNVKPEKGFEDLIEATAALRDARGRDDFVVWIAGDTGDEAYSQQLQATCQRLGIGKTVRFLGFRRDTAALYSAADAFVLSSRKEGLPMVLLEAMSARLPVVATRVGAVPSVIDDGADGLLVPPASPPKLAEAMARLLAEPDIRSKLGNAAAAKAESGYGVEQMARHYLRVFGEAVIATGKLPAERAALPRVLQLGPIPPLTGGMATVIDNLCRSQLAERVNLSQLNNGKMTRPDRTLGEGVRAQIRLLGRLIGLIRRLRINVVHLHTCEFMGFWRDCVHALAAGVLGTRVVWHVHGARFDQWARRQGPARRAILRAAFERAAAVIVLSTDWLRRLRPFAPRANWHVIPNGIPMPYTPEPIDGEPSVLFLGDWTPRKGVKDLVAATAMAVREHGFAGKVRLAGFEKEPGQRADLDRAIADSGCADHIEVLGLLSGRQKDAALRAAWGMILPSHGEGLPMAILEAMGHGRAVLATRVGAIPELITERREGLLFDPGDIAAIAKSLVQLCGEADLARRMGHAARQCVERDYSLDVMAQRVMEVYSKVLSAPAGSKAIEEIQ